MTSALLAAVLLVCTAATKHDYGVAAVERLETTSDDAEVDDEGDFAPFMIVLDHMDGWRCAGSLVSLRTALTSAWCVRGRGPTASRELWAIAASAAALPVSDAGSAARKHGARRVTRVAVATGADAEINEGSELEREWSWHGGAMDLALVELEQPFGSGAQARPILMATASGECSGGGGGGQCHVSRALPGSTRRTTLRIVSADIAPPETCARAASYWAAVRDRALCLVGPQLCSSDWGGGVVCGGKLCGVLSRSVRAAAEGPRTDDCGDTHAAQSVAQWRRFLHCAHTLRACGRGGDCADLCIERQLIDESETPEDEPATEEPSTEEPSTRPSERTRTTTSTTTETTTTTTTEPTTERPVHYPTRVSRPSTTAPTRVRSTHAGSRVKGRKFVPVRVRSTEHTRTATYAPMLAHLTPPLPAGVPAGVPAPRTAASPAPPAGEDAPSSRPSFEFEPNRADFKAASASLKAGEYGDNAADYGDEEPAATAPTTPGTSTPAGLSARPVPAGAEPQPAERRAAPLARVTVSEKSSAKKTSLYTFLMISTFVFVCSI